MLAQEPVDVLAVEAARLAADARWLESLRANVAPGLMVLGLASSHEEEELAPLLAAGVDEYLVAPFAPSEVMGRLTLLAQRRAASASALGERGEGEVARLANIIQLQGDIMQAGLDLHRVMQRICEQARVLCHAEGAAVGILEGDELAYRVSAGSAEPFDGFRPKVEQSLTGVSVLLGEVLHTRDTETDERVNREATRQLGIRSMITVPLRDGLRVTGALNIVSRRPHAFTEHDARTMELLAVILGTALANAAEYTERKQAEAALRRSEESFRALIEGSPEAILVHRGGPLLYVNPFAVKFLGLPASKLVGTSVLQYVYCEDRDVAMGVLDAPPELVRPGASELRFVQPNGRVMTAEVSCLSIVFQGEPSTVVSARDLTDRKQMQSRLVMSDRLVAMGTLAAGVAHEINNPLTFVISNLSFLANELQTLSGEVSPGRLNELDEVLREAAMGANKVRQIVADLKTFSRADDDMPATVNLQNVLESALTIARAELRARARVVRDYKEVPPVEGSEGRLGQVFLNLLINAAQAISPGQPEHNEIRIALRAVQDHVIIEIHDTGAGIPPEMRARIFDPFFTTKPVGVGTGLGLFVCQGIITRFGGEISVESEMGQGTTFRVIFPAARGFRSLRLTPVPIAGEGDGTRA
ncbi:MAG TPA: ATP-binding protein [Hyalangium sp.]|jgi:PAS domain S-box-containing protein|nr:ATP-binding protein [Hyalangium sp.]